MSLPLARSVGFHRPAAREFAFGALRAAGWGLAYAAALSLPAAFIGQHGVPMATAPLTVQDTQADAQQAFAAQVTAFNTMHGCQDVASWKRAHPGRLPAGMVQHADGSGALTVVRWTYPAAPGEWVVGLCSR